jgi:signal transduction histidine kinase
MSSDDPMDCLSATMQYNDLMRRLLKFGLLDFAGVFTVGAVAVISFISIDETVPRWLSLALTLGFAALLVFHPAEAPPAVKHAYFGAQTLLTVGLLLLQPNQFAAPVLFFILSAEVMTTLPTRPALAWIGTYLLITFVFAATLSDPLNGLVFTLPYAGGYLFFGTFGKALRDTEMARVESQRLLSELRAAQDQLKALAIAEERNRLAREMHDSLGHRLTVAVVQLEGAQRLIPTDPERAARMIGAMREQMKEALADLRRTVATLRTPLAGDRPLEAALAQLARDFQESTGLPVHLRLPPGLPALSEPGRLALYRAAQEALTNAQRHAGATNVWLEVQAREGRMTLTADDDGRGYPPELNGGFGLRGLRERAAQLGGEVGLDARPGGGARLSFSIPLMTDEGRPTTDDANH